LCLSYIFFLQIFSEHQDRVQAQNQEKQLLLAPVPAQARAVPPSAAGTVTAATAAAVHKGLDADRHHLQEQQGQGQGQAHRRPSSPPLVHAVVSSNHESGGEVSATAVPVAGAGKHTLATDEPRNPSSSDVASSMDLGNNRPFSSNGGGGGGKALYVHTDDASAATARDRDSVSISGSMDSEASPQSPTHAAGAGAGAAGLMGVDLLATNGLLQKRLSRTASGLAADQALLPEFGDLSPVPNAAPLRSSVEFRRKSVDMSFMLSTMKASAAAANGQHLGDGAAAAADAEGDDIESRSGNNRMWQSAGNDYATPMIGTNNRTTTTGLYGGNTGAETTGSERVSRALVMDSPESSPISARPASIIEEDDAN
jgi:hypothetical protein